MNGYAAGSMVVNDGLTGLIPIPFRRALRPGLQGLRNGPIGGVMKTWHKPVAQAFLAAAGWASSAPAFALTTLDVWLSDFSCSFTNASGVTSALACAGSQVSKSLAPGESMRIDALANYRYHDDGLPATGWFPYQGDPYNVSWRTVSHEFGALSVIGAYTCRLGCYPPGFEGFGTYGLPAMILGENDQPDDLAGSFAVTAGKRVLPESSLGWGATVSFAVETRTYSGTVSPIPEPSTYGLMALGLGLLAAFSRRRTQPA